MTCSVNPFYLHVPSGYMGVNYGKIQTAIIISYICGYPFSDLRMICLRSVGDNRYQYILTPKKMFISTLSLF